MSQRSPRRLRRWLVAVLLAGVATAAFATPAFAESGLNPIVPSGDTPMARNIYNLYLLISPFAIFIFLLVEILLLIIIFKWRRSRLPSDYKPPQWHGHTGLEITWTVIPFLILIVVGYFSFLELQQDFVRPADSVTDLDVSVMAHQYGWTYSYPDGVTVNSEGLQASDAPLVVPVGKLVRLKMDSKDVIHSFWVPDLGGKTDAVPGYSNYTWIKADRAGEWRGQCAELCGSGHATMQIRVKAVSESDFEAWLAQQKAKSSPSPSAAPSPSPSVAPSPSPSPTGG
jgi:cytochrome c oxidase subunit II